MCTEISEHSHPPLKQHRCARLPNHFNKSSLMFCHAYLKQVLVDPSHWHCAPAIQKMIGGGPIWGLVAAAGLWAAWLGFLAIEWDWVARRLVDRLERDERLALSDTGVGLSWVLVNFRVRSARGRLFLVLMVDYGYMYC